MKSLFVAALFSAFLLPHAAQAGFDARAVPGTVVKAGPAGALGAPSEKGKTGRQLGAYREGELLVKFKPDVSPEQKKSLHARHGSEKIREFPRLRLHHVKLKKGVSVADAIDLYQKDPSVEYAEPNYFRHLQQLPNDARFGELWGLNNTAQNGGKVGADIKAVSAWDVSTGSSDVVVAVIDTGIDYTHPDLQANAWVNDAETADNGRDDDGNGYVDDVHGINAIEGADLPGDPMDDNGHGTHVSGTIGAAGNNGSGVVGVNWNVKIVGCKFLSAEGYGDDAGAVNCLEYVRVLKDRGVNIVATSNSWGGGSYSQALYDAISAQRDILFIAAAGNSGANTDYSANYPSGYALPNIVSVAATDSSDSLASFSNYGRSSVDVGAPGVGILSTVAATNRFGISTGYGTLSGTSMATPHVSGLAALLKAHTPSLGAQQIRNLILTGGDSISALASTTVTGKRINAYNSLTCSNRKLFNLGQLPRKVYPGQTYTISAASIICDSVAGPVKVTTSEGDTIELHDDGIAPDLLAGDGIFTGSFSPRSQWVTITASSPAGSASAAFNGLEIGYHLPKARQDAYYSQPLFATGGTAPYTWRMVSGYLQGGLNLNSNGTITGTPNINGSCNGACGFTAEATDAAGNKVTRVELMIVEQSWVQESWGRVYDSSAEDQGVAVARDGSGNTYVTGKTDNGVDFDLLLLKYGSDGALIWKKNYDKGGDETGRSVVCDKSGNVYVAGVSGTPGDHLLLKYDGAGNLLWEKIWDAGGDDGAFGVTLDTAGNLYTVGSFDSALGGRVLLAKYDPTGGPIWSRTHDTSAGDESGYSVAVDGSGNVFFGGAVSTTTGSDFLAAKFDASGNALWSTTLHDGTSSTFTGVAVDAGGNLYATGYSSSDSATHGVTVKYDPAGNLLWQASPTATSVLDTKNRDFSPLGIAVAGDKVFVAGTVRPWYDTDLILFRYDTLGNQVWRQTVDIGVNSRDFGTGISADSGGVNVVGNSYNGVDNDVFTARFTEPSPIYDIQLTGLDATLQGPYLDYTVKVKNNGIGLPYAQIALYLSTDATFSADDIRLSPVIETDVQGGTEKTYVNWPHDDPDKIILIPATVPPGTYYVIAVADPDNAINEIRENNNVFVGGKVLVNSDLTVSAVSGTVINGNLSYWVRVKSSANFAVSTSTTGIYLSSDPSSPGYLLATVSTPTPGAGGESVLSGTVPIPASIPPGTYYVTAVADTGNAIVESDETNNLFAGNIVTLSNDLTLTGLSGTLSGGVLSYSVTVKNSGRQSVAPEVGLYFSDDATASTSDRLISVIKAGTIAGDSQATLTGTAVIPATIAQGTYYLVALADPANVVVESVKSNNGATAGSYTVDFTGTPLNYSLHGGGTGTVTFSPGTTCSGDCTQSYLPGTMVTVTAAPAPGSSFAGWGGACSGTGSCTVSITGTKALSATFVRTMATVVIDERHMEALISGELWGWGDNAIGEYGDGTSSSSRLPRRGILAGVTAMAAGRNFMLALQDGGTVWSWGINGQGQIGDGTTTTRTSAFQVPGLARVVSISASSIGSAAVTADGNLWAWGDNSYGQIGDGTTTRRVVPVQVTGISGVAAVASGGTHTLALKPDGTVWSWGDNAYGQLGIDVETRKRYTQQGIDGISGMVAIAAGYSYSIALKGDGTVWSWGSNGNGELGVGNTIQHFTPFPIPGLSDVVAIAGGYSHVLALKRDGTVWAWGDNYYGQIGDGTTTDRLAPVQVPGITGAVSIAAGLSNSSATTSDGRVWTWGANYYGQIGDGSTTQRLSPVPVSFDTVAPVTTASPAGGVYATAQTVTLTANEGATIYYTLDGSIPTTGSALYTAPLTISASATVNYFAVDAAGNKEGVKSQSYSIGSAVAPTAGFGAAASAGEAPFTATFSDASTGAPTSWFWDFGDDSTSTLQNPQHVYNASGSYTVSLRVTNGAGSSTVTKSGFVSVSDPGVTSLQSAYDAAADGADIKLRAGNLFEDPLLQRDIKVKIGGGYDSPYLSVIGATVIHGKMTIRKGTVSVGNIVLE